MYAAHTCTASHHLACSIGCRMWFGNTLLFCAIAVSVHDLLEATDQGIVLSIQGIIECIGMSSACLNQVLSGCACQQFEDARICNVQDTLAVHLACSKHGILRQKKHIMQFRLMQVVPVFAGGLDFSAPVKKFFYDPIYKSTNFVDCVVSLTG